MNQPGAMFAVMRAVGVPTPRAGGKTVKMLNWLGAKKVDYPKGRSHRDDLPLEWAPYVHFMDSIACTIPSSFPFLSFPFLLFWGYGVLLTR